MASIKVQKSRFALLTIEDDDSDDGGQKESQAARKSAGQSNAQKKKNKKKKQQQNQAEIEEVLLFLFISLQKWFVFLLSKNNMNLGIFSKYCKLTAVDTYEIYLTDYLSIYSSLLV